MGVFERYPDKNVTLNAKNLVIRCDTVPFVGHEISATGINMSKKQIESAISFCKPNSLKELQSFLGLVNYFKDHLRDHSSIAKPLYDIVTVTRIKIKHLTWTNERHLAFFAWMIWLAEYTSRYERITGTCCS